MTNEQRLARMRRDGTTGIVDYITIGPEEDAALAAGAEALRLLREYRETASVVRALNEDGGGPSAEVFSAACDRYDAAKDALLATEVTR